MDPGKLLEGLLDKKELAILRHCSRNPDKQFYLRELSKATRVPVATVFRITKKLADLNILAIEKVKHLKLYSYADTKEANFVEQLIEIRKGAVEEFVDACRQIPGIEQVILHGRKQKDRANFLIIGQNVPTEPLVQVQGGIKERLNFSVIYLVLGPSQYAQMADMGLYAGDRQVLLEK